MILDEKMVGGVGDFCIKLNYWFQRYQMVGNFKSAVTMGSFGL